MRIAKAAIRRFRPIERRHSSLDILRRGFEPPKRGVRHLPFCGERFRDHEIFPLGQPLTVFPLSDGLNADADDRSGLFIVFAERADHVMDRGESLHGPDHTTQCSIVKGLQKVDSLSGRRRSDSAACRSAKCT